MTSAVLDESYAAALDAAGNTGGASEFVQLLVDTCRRVRSTAIHLGVLDLGRESTADLLARLAGLRRTELYGFRLGARLVGSTTEAGAGLLRAAGLVHVELPGQPPKPGADPEAVLLGRIEAVATLHEQGIDVAWQFPPGPTTPTGQAAMADLLPLLHHLPPPTGADSDQDRLAAALTAWRRAHIPRRLTYGRGPGFVRIFDRREHDTVVTFVTLDGAQAQVFLAAGRAAPPEELARQAPGVPVEAVTRFLDRLVERRLMCRTRGGDYQRLPIRRRIEERWVEGGS